MVITVQVQANMKRRGCMLRCRLDGVPGMLKAADMNSSKGQELSKELEMHALLLGSEVQRAGMVPVVQDAGTWVRTRRSQH